MLCPSSLIKYYYSQQWFPMMNWKKFTVHVPGASASLNWNKNAPPDTSCPLKDDTKIVRAALWCTRRMRSSRRVVCAALNPKSLRPSHLWVMTMRTKTKVHWSGRSITKYMPADGIERSNRKTRGKLSCQSMRRSSLIILGNTGYPSFFHVTRSPTAISFLPWTPPPSLPPFPSPWKFYLTFYCGSLFSTVFLHLARKLKTSNPGNVDRCNMIEVSWLLRAPTTRSDSAICSSLFDSNPVVRAVSEEGRCVIIVLVTWYDGRLKKCRCVC